MTSFNSSRESIPHPPGYFPTDDMSPTTEDTTLTSLGSQHQRNKLHKREDPRGWSDEEKATRGHQYTDSGIGLTDSAYASDPQTRNTANENTLLSNNTALKGQGATPKSATTATESTGYRGVSSKPGVMTGAYSHMDNSNDDRSYPTTATQDSTTRDPTSTKGIGAAGSETGIATAARPNDTEQQLGDNDRNIVRNGLRQTSNIDHNDPYWGDVPYGTGIYNSVAGHGSSETPAEGSVHPHGSTLNNDHQRAFPLSTSENTIHEEAGHQNGSRFKEGLAESGAAAGAGVAASELAGKRRDHKPDNDLREPTSHKHEETEPKKESRLAGLFHRDHKTKESKPETKQEAKEEKKEEKKLRERAPSKDDRPLTDRDAGAALAAATVAHGAKDKHDKKPKQSESGLRDNEANELYQLPNEKISNSAGDLKTQRQTPKDPFVAAGYTGPKSQSTAKSANTYPASEDVTTRGHLFTSQTAEKSTDKNDSRLGYGLAAVGVGAGAGYAAHEYSNKDSNRTKEPVAQTAYDKPTTTSSKATAQPANSGYTIGQPQLGVVSGTTNTATPSKKQIVPQNNPSAYDSRTDPTRHGEYNILQDGTPSGVNIGDHYDDAKNPTWSSPSAARNTTTKDNHNGVKAAATGAGVAGAGAAGYYANRDSDKFLENETRHPAYRSSRDVQNPYTETAGTSSRAPVNSGRGGEYNTLHDSTPSGVNVSDRYNDKNIASSPSTSTTPHAKKDKDHDAAKIATAAGVAGVAGTGAAAKHRSHQDTVNGKRTVESTTTARDHHPTAAGTSPTGGQKKVTIAGTSPTSSTRGRSSTDSSHGGQYNVLPSGTPSGINIGEHENTGRRSLENNTASTKTKPSPTAAAAGAVPRKEGKEKDMAKAGGGAAAAATAAAIPASKATGDKVLHRCRKCGEENDITGYFQK